jgi:hypothetical protein
LEAAAVPDVVLLLSPHITPSSVMPLPLDPPTRSSTTLHSANACWAARVLMTFKARGLQCRQPAKARGRSLKGSKGRATHSGRTALMLL